MVVEKSKEQIQLTKEAFMVYSHGGAIECEIQPDVWVEITQPLEFEMSSRTDSVMDDLNNLDFRSTSSTFRPKYPK